MILAPGLRKLALVIHLTTSLGWIGAVLAYLGLGVASIRTNDVEVIRSAWTAMDVTGWWVITPLAIAALLTGVVLSLGTQWGLFRHYWVVISLALTLLCTIVLVFHMPSVSATARVARGADAAMLSKLGGDLFHPAAGLVLLLLVAVLNVYKPAGLTPYGWRRRNTPRRPRVTSAEPVGGTSMLRSVASSAGSCACYFAEMWFAMLHGCGSPPTRMR